MNIKRTCRTCLSITENLISPRTVKVLNNNVSITYSEMILLCTNVQLSDHDTILIEICDNCQLNAINAYLFRQKVIEADEYYHTHLNDEPDLSNIGCEINYEIPNYGLKENLIGELLDNNIIKNDDVIEEDDNINEANLISQDTNKCIICGKVFSDTALLLSHVQNNHSYFMKTRDSKSTTLAAKFSKRTTPLVKDKSKQENNKKKVNENEYSCSQCDKTYKIAASLKMHIYRSHNKTQSKYARICSVCGEGFEKASFKFYDHYRKHFPELCLKCTYCDRMFTRKKEYNLHILTHTGEKPFQCDICDFRCASKYQIKSHMRIHSDERPFKCNLCDAKFKLAQRLADHKIIHTNDGAFKCIMCGKTFNRNILLKRHMIAHSEDRPYQCEYCGKNYKCSKHWKHHLKTHLGDRKYVCDICGKSFAHSNSLRHHIGQHGTGGVKRKIRSRTSKNKSIITNIGLDEIEGVIENGIS